MEEAIDLMLGIGHEIFALDLLLLQAYPLRASAEIIKGSDEYTGM